MVELDRGVEEHRQPLKGLMDKLGQAARNRRQPLKGLIIIRPGEPPLP